MTQRNWWLMICMSLLITTFGCNQQKTPQATTSKQANSSVAATSPSPSWKVIKGNGVEISLPPNYVGGNPSKEEDLNAIASKLKTINPEYEQRIASLKQNPNANAIALLAFDTQNDQSGFLTNVNITTQAVEKGTTLDKYLQTASQQLAVQYDILERKVVPLGKDKVGRIITQPKASGAPIKQLFYIVPQSNRFWLITYSTSQTEFDKRLPNFEKSIRSFKVVS